MGLWNTLQTWGLSKLRRSVGFTFKNFIIIKFIVSLRYRPDEKQTRKWENAMTLDTQSWGYRRNAKLRDYFTAKVIFQNTRWVKSSCFYATLMGAKKTSQFSKIIFPSLSYIKSL